MLQYTHSRSSLTQLVSAKVGEKEPELQISKIMLFPFVYGFQPTECEKIFANNVTDNRLISKIYKELIQLNIKKNRKI